MTWTLDEITPSRQPRDKLFRIIAEPPPPRSRANATLRDAEAYCRTMSYGGAESWTLRDRHMFETLETWPTGL